MQAIGHIVFIVAKVQNFTFSIPHCFSLAEIWITGYCGLGWLWRAVAKTQCAMCRFQFYCCTSMTCCVIQHFALQMKQVKVKAIMTNWQIELLH